MTRQIPLAPVGVVLALLSVGLAPLARATSILTESPGPGDFVLSAEGVSAALFVDTGEDRAVRRAAGDLADDVERVTGAKPRLTQSLTDAPSHVVIIGSLGRSATLERLAAAGKLDVGPLRGAWESFVLQVVEAPLPGIEQALVIAGSDRRGAIYGVYELSEAIGVSPWYWWADVPPRKRAFAAVRAGVVRRGPPAVKYRGIFLNDEDWGLRPWAAKTFEPETGHIGPRTYARIFELLLRLRANFLWPAMHPDTRAFNYFPENKDLADAYGIVMGSSHCEQMLRDNVDEWKTAVHGEYDYVKNRPGVLRYWEERVRENGRYESVFTLGMRGIHDSGMPGGGTLDEQAARLHAIIADQRDLLRTWVAGDVARVPQIFCPYKEVLELYQKAPDIPSDITLVWPDDNWGYVRQFSNESERARAGGAGVYYHISYWGRPYDYLWLYSTPPALMAEELGKAHDLGARTLWVLNVGDIKPAELGTEFGLRLAWDPKIEGARDASAALLAPLTRDFGPVLGPEIAALFDEYFRLSVQRKPEHMGLDARHPLLGRPVFSATENGDEVERRLTAWRNLVARLDGLASRVPPTHADAFFELVAYPLRAAALMNEKGLELTRFHVHTQQRRASAGTCLERAQNAHDGILALTAEYNDRLAGGKWRHMMSAAPRNLGVFKRPEAVPPAVPEGALLGIALEGSAEALLPPPPGASATTTPRGRLPEFNALTRRPYFVDVFRVGQAPVQWAARADEDWILPSHRSGQGDQRVSVAVDWTRVPTGDSVRGTLRITGPGQEMVVDVTVFNPASLEAPRTGDFVEDAKRVAMEAEHATAVLPGGDAAWTTLRGLGYNGSAVAAAPATAPVRTDGARIRAESPRLEYRLWLRTPGDWNVTVRALPTWSVETGQPQRYAIAFDDAAPQVVPVGVYTDEHNRQWQEDVLRNAALSTSTHSIGRPGVHTLKVWMVDPGIVVDAIFADAGSGRALGYLGPDETRIAAP